MPSWNRKSESITIFIIKYSVNMEVHHTVVNKVVVACRFGIDLFHRKILRYRCNKFLLVMIASWIWLHQWVVTQHTLTNIITDVIVPKSNDCVETGFAKLMLNGTLADMVMSARQLFSTRIWCLRRKDRQLQNDYASDCVVSSCKITKTGTENVRKPTTTTTIIEITVGTTSVKIITVMIVRKTTKM